MLIGGLQKFSLIDYPGKLSAIIFTQGCNFRCPYCHNPELVDPKQFIPLLDEKKVLDFLETRRGRLDAVEITGGEPTLQKDLLPFLQKIKKMGFLVKLDTNGSSPSIMQEALRKKVVDYFALDVKAPLEKYQEVTRSTIDPQKIQKAIQIIMSSGLDYEFRTTIVRSMLSFDDITKIAQLIRGANLYALQAFIPSKTLDPHFQKETSYTEEELEKICQQVQPYVQKCIIRS